MFTHVTDVTSSTMALRIRLNKTKSAVRNSKLDNNADCMNLYRHYFDPEHTLAVLLVTILQICAKSDDLPKAG